MLHEDDLTSRLCYFHINSLFVTCITPPLQEIDAVFPSVKTAEESHPTMHPTKGTLVSFQSDVNHSAAKYWYSNADISFSSFYSFLPSFLPALKLQMYLFIYFGPNQPPFLNMFYYMTLRSFHTKSPKFLSKNFCTLKNKDDLTLYQWRLHTAAKTFVHHKKFGSGKNFCFFASVTSILIAIGSRALPCIG